MEITFCFIIACATGLVLLYYYIQNKGRRIERYFMRHKKEFFIILQGAYFVLTLSLVFNIRFIIYKFAQGWLEKAQQALAQK